ncbi:DNA-binding protein [Methanoculleus taiwanensis]|uniref:DNA-binding protein n=1 Tax=Methanoculleus taiwanensis TaxID=1550565 RepID=A0A498H1H1_9EURY|nr:helix-turn-helix domain-containing protein [Methanoculleus taiwanensis]RXE56185.1 DNA-binding protein [Methanoculleus taiwanensis]
MTRDAEPGTSEEIWGLVDPDRTKKMRRDAIEDGELIEITRMGKDIGIRYPLAVSARAAERLVPFPNIPQDTVTENLWDTLHAFREKALSTAAPELLFSVSLYQNGLVPTLTFKATVSAGDEGEPVITIMTPEENWEEIGGSVPPSAIPAGHPLLTVEEVARMLKFSPRRIRTFIRDERIPAVKCGGSWRVRRSDIERIITDGF